MPCQISACYRVEMYPQDVHFKATIGSVLKTNARFVLPSRRWPKKWGPSPSVPVSTRLPFHIQHGLTTGYCQSQLHMSCRNHPTCFLSSDVAKLNTFIKTWKPLRSLYPPSKSSIWRASYRSMSTSLLITLYVNVCTEFQYTPVTKLLI